MILQISSNFVVIRKGTGANIISAAGGMETTPIKLTELFCEYLRYLRGKERKNTLMPQTCSEFSRTIAQINTDFMHRLFFLTGDG